MSESIDTSDCIRTLKNLECRDASFLEASPPLVYKSAVGMYVTDTDNKRYLDFCAGFGVHALGHNHSIHQELFAAQANNEAPPVVHGMGDVYPSIDKVRLIKQLSSMLPDQLSRVSLALSGGQAVELAVKTAILRKPGLIVSCSGSYHGLDLGILSLTSREDFKQPFSMWMPKHSCLEILFNTNDLDKILSHAKKIDLPLSAVIVEPIQGRAGVRPADYSFLHSLRQLCDQEDALLIYDEVFTGLGRSGRISFASEVPCDLLCLGKALGGGFPLSACVGTAEAMDAWPRNDGEALHTGTFFGHPLSCRFAEKTLSYIVDQKLDQRAKNMGAGFKTQLEARLLSHDLVESIRGDGLMLGVVFKHDLVGVKMTDILRAMGMITLPSGQKGEVLSLTPPLIVSAEDLARGVELIERALATL